MSTPVENPPINTINLSRQSSFFNINSPGTPGTPVTQNSKLLDFWNLVVAEENATWESLYVNIAIYLEVDLEKLDTVKLRKRLDPANTLANPTLPKLALAIKDGSPEVYFQKFLVSGLAEKSDVKVDQTVKENVDAKAQPAPVATPPIEQSIAPTKNVFPLPIAKVQFISEESSKLSASKFEIDLSHEDLFTGLPANSPKPETAPVGSATSPTPNFELTSPKNDLASPRIEIASPRGEPALPKKSTEKPQTLPLKSLKDIKPEPIEESPINRPVLDPIAKTLSDAEKGNVQAMCQLASYYMTGKHTAQDTNLAFQWYSKAASQNDPEALNSLAMFYLKGIQTDKDIYKAVELYSSAANLNSPSGMYNLAMCFRDGIGYAKDEVKAVDWFQKASNMGNIAAMNRLGMCYQLGTGVKEDKSHAFALYLKASESGNAKAYFNLATCYEQGIGTAKDVQKAFEYFMKSAEKGNAKAQYRVGEMYEKGVGTERDKDLAKEWKKKAVEQGYQKESCSIQ